MCWLDHHQKTPVFSTQDESGESGYVDLTKLYNVCVDLKPSLTQYMNSTVGDRWHVISKTKNRQRLMLIVGGKHHYTIDESFFTYTENAQIEKMHQEDSIAYVYTHHQCVKDGQDSGWDVLGPTWRDATRVGAYRQNLALCMCGDHNASSTFTVDVSNPEVPIIVHGDKCRCPRISGTVPEHWKDSPMFDMWIPCSYARNDPDHLAKFEPCKFLENSPKKHPEEVRIHMLHTTTEVDRLSLKTKMYDSLWHVFGPQEAALVMPRTYFLKDANDYEELRAAATADPSRHNTYIFKDENLHRQLGINIMTGAAFLKGGTSDLIGIATEFIPRPYLVQGYKINLRRYMVTVCTGGRLRGYVHEDGKNIYTRDPYREPWEGDPWDEDEGTEGMTDAEKAQDRIKKDAEFKKRTAEMITTGYVPSNHFDGKPLSGVEFFEYVQKEDGRHPWHLQESMWVRLSLALHAANNDREFNLCHTDPKQTRTTAYPQCLENAVRFQHFGCDFHIDADLTGYESRLFECNKGPDMSVHSFRDGKMKRDVAADIMAFMGFKGPFDGSEEHAAQHRLHLIYDSDIPFDAEAAFAYLEGLQYESSILKEEAGRDEL